MEKKKRKLKSMKDIKKSITKSKPKKKAKKKKTGNILGITLITLGIICMTTIISFSLYIVFTSPEFTTETLYNVESSNIFWKDGSLMTKLGTENRENKNYEDFPQVLVDALIATEDSRFFQHSGFDAARFTKASFGQLLGKNAGGASTLSMQLSKNYFTSYEDSGIEGIIRKFQDIYMAVFKIEKNYTKEQIIEMYLNSWWFAGGGTNFEGTYGVEQASQYYFGKSISNISLPEAAVLVGMVNNPSIYNPYIYPGNANERKNIVLSLMNRHGYITEEEMKDAQAIDVRSLITTNTSSTSDIQPLIDYVINEVQANEKINLSKGGYDVYTTFDKNIQSVVTNMLNGAAAPWKDDKIQSATAITSVVDGSISALGPGRHYVAKGDNRASDKARFRQQPGSTAKPLVDYGPLIEYNNASSGQMFIDFKYTYNDGTVLNNWDNSYKGVMTMKDALSSSRNVTALEAFHQVSTNNIKTFLNNLGIDEENYGEEGIVQAMSVGGFKYGLTPLESSAAYGAFARGGYYIEPYSYTKIVNRETEETKEFKYEKKRAMSEETAYMITDILLQATNEGVGGSINWNLRGSIASKSGTTNIDSETASQKNISIYTTPDHWVNTYNTEYSISMWYGYDRKDLDKDHYLTSNTGTGTRGKISAYLANNILTKNEKFTKPSGIVNVTIEKNTLPTKRASEYTPENMKQSAYFKQGTEPSETSGRFAKLSDPKNGSGTFNKNIISIKWDAATTPDSLNSSAVRTEFANHFKNYKKSYNYSYQLFEDEYMKLYDSYTTSSIGTFGYQIYLKDEKGNLTSLGWTQNTNYTYTAPASGNYTFVIKSAYSIFKDNQSSGIEVKVNIKDVAGEEKGLKAKAQDVCLEKGKTFNAKDYLQITFDGVDVTNDAIITTSNLDTSKLGEVTVTYSITYKEKQIQITGKVNISDKCENTN